MANPIGISFLPTDENSPEGRGQPSSLGQALEILSLRLPKVRGARGISPQVYGQGAPPGGFNPYAEIIKAMMDAAKGGSGTAPPLAPPRLPGGGGAPPGPGAGGASPLAPPRLPGGVGAPPPTGGGPMAPMGGGGNPSPPMPPLPMPQPLPSLPPPPPSGPPSPKIIPADRRPSLLPPNPVDRVPVGPSGRIPTVEWPRPPVDGVPPPWMPTPSPGGADFDIPAAAGSLIDASGGDMPTPDALKEFYDARGGELPLQPRRRGQWNEYFFS